MREVEIRTEFIKLDQLLKFAGVVQTGGEGKIIISEGMVSVNGNVIKERGKKIRKGDIIEIENTEKLVVI